MKGSMCVQRCRRKAKCKKTAAVKEGDKTPACAAAAWPTQALFLVITMTGQPD